MRKSLFKGIILNSISLEKGFNLFKKIQFVQGFRLILNIGCSDTGIVMHNGFFKNIINKIGPSPGYMTPKKMKFGYGWTIANSQRLCKESAHQVS